jgi:hypothetical protein
MLKRKGRAVRLLTAFLVVIGVLSISALRLTAQGSLPALSADQVRYFVSFFERVGSADVDARLLAHNEAAVDGFYDLTQAESTALHSAAQAYRAQMTQIRLSEKAIVSSKPELNDSDRASIAQLVQSRNQMVSGIASGFLGSLRASTVTRLLADANETIKARTAKGVH